VEARGFNPKYLLEGLEQFKAKKVHTVTMKMGHPHSPIILTDNKDDLAMVLPVR
ncbi:Transposon-encoded protein TnpW, partial [Dysosmobacter welbionis]